MTPRGSRSTPAAAPLASPPGDFEIDLVPPRPAWRRNAACRGVGPAAFYPDRGESLEAARWFCTGCSVTVECAAAGADEKHGVWGGLSGRQRRIVRRSAA